jgi:uncharacterized RDD family membrane protein YckC
VSDEPQSPFPGDARPAGPFGRFFSARPQGSPYPKAELLPRLVARLTDFIVAAFLCLSAGEAGTSLAVLYLLFADGFLHGQSPGKRLLGVKVIYLRTCREAEYRESALRNFPFAFVLLFHLLPSVGHLVLWSAGAALLLLEGLRALFDKLGLRLGDLFAQTQVVDAKALVGAQVNPALKVVRSEPGRVRGAAQVLLEPTRTDEP